MRELDMDDYTSTEDWLHTQAASMDDLFISGDLTFSQKLGLKQKSITSLRFAANRQDIFGYFLTIRAPKIAWRDLECEIINSELFKIKIEYFSKLLNSEIPVIIYDNLNQDIFFISFDTKNFMNVNSEKLKEHFTKLNSRITENPGTFKAINRSINDSFQKWTRNNLSRYLVINDFDIIIKGKSLIIELKRVKEGLNSWRPYLDDKGNYLALLNICKSNKLKLLVVTYNYDIHDIALHDITSISESEICGRFCICKLDNLANLSLDSYDFHHYVSNRRRQ